ncbi:KH domain-containing protein, partial [Candidatus Woesearchaeota archaeon]|nr:KH domain-containing protein [Candidatus Woesearchaeota archaeon]
KEVERVMQRYADSVVVEFPSESKAIVKVPESSIASIIGKQGKNIEKIQKQLGVHIDVQPLEGGALRESKQPSGEEVPYELNIKRKSIELYVDSSFANRDLDVYVGDEFLVELHVGKRAMVKIRKDNNIGKVLLKAKNRGEEIRIYG